MVGRMLGLQIPETRFSPPCPYKNTRPLEHAIILVLGKQRQGFWGVIFVCLA